MRNLKRTMLAAALLISLSAAGAAMGNGVSAASLEAKEPAGPVSSTGRDYRIALINADRSNGPVIHRPMKEEVRPEKPAAPSDEVKDRKGGEDFRDSRSALQRGNKDDDHPYEGRHERRFDKDDRDGDHHYDGRRQHHFDKDHKDGDHHYDGHHQRRFDKDHKDGEHHYDGRHQHRFAKGHRDGDHRYDGRRHDRNGRGPVPRAPEDAQF
jgi:hypothetical protein